MSITALTITYNSAATISRLVRSVREYLGGSVTEFLIIDNHSSDTTTATVRALKDEWSAIRFIENSVNTGYRKAINQAAKLAANELLLIINPDAWLVDDSVRECLALVAADPEVGYVSPVIIEPEQPPAISRSYGSTVVVPFLVGFPGPLPAHSKTGTVDAGSGAAFVIRRSYFLTAGGYDEGIFMYNEEEELSTKLRAKGKRTQVLSAARVYHGLGVSVRSIGPRLEFLFPRVLVNARFLYYRRSRDSGVRRVLWAFLFFVQALEYSIAVKGGAPMRAALSPWRAAETGPAAVSLMNPNWRLRLWVPAKLRDLELLHPLMAK